MYPVLLVRTGLPFNDRRRSRIEEKADIMTIMHAQLSKCKMEGITHVESVGTEGGSFTMFQLTQSNETVISKHTSF